MSALSDAHETRTEASGTESEIVNRKTPSLHSDLSDSESDSASSSSDGGSNNKRAKRTMEATQSFQESGIFDGGPCEVQHIATQTEVRGSSMRSRWGEGRQFHPVKKYFWGGIGRRMSVHYATCYSYL